MSFEESLIRNASPTLANIKVANLYNFRFNSVNECNETIKYYNSIMNFRGVYVELLKHSQNFFLIYVYRKTRLLETIHNNEIEKFLDERGYRELDTLEEYFTILKNRFLSENEFPHEIGVFLGYPLLDVKAFIKTKGKHCKMCGDWKVYHDEENALCQFCQFKNCKKVYMQAYQTGRSISDMLVSA